MADLFTTASSGANQSPLVNQILTAWRKAFLFPYRAGLVFDQFATVIDKTDTTTPGNPVKVGFWDDLAVSTTPLTESVQPDAVAFTEGTPVTITPAEYGITTKVTKRLVADTFLPDFDPNKANLLGYNMLATLEALARVPLDASTNIAFAGAATSEGTMAQTDVIAMNLLRKQHAIMASAAVTPVLNSAFYAAIIHPDVAHDLKVETGDGKWVQPTQYQAGEVNKLYTNVLGQFAGFMYLESPRASKTVGAVDKYTTYLLGAEAFAKVVTVAPTIIPGPVIDPMQRFMPLSWYGYLGYGALRAASTRLIRSSSSIVT